MLGQPLGVGQGDNPTCQSARALSWWACSDPDYLLQLLAWAGRDDGILMTFRGQQISSAFLPAGASGQVGSDLDPVSMVLVPHLDRVYAEMCRLAHKAGEDPHLHVNPEFHGWQVGGGFAIAVDVLDGNLHEYEEFVRMFYACYHPNYNGGNPWQDSLAGMRSRYCGSPLIRQVRRVSTFLIRITTVVRIWEMESSYPQMALAKCTVNLLYR